MVGPNARRRPVAVDYWEDCLVCSCTKGITGPSVEV